MNQNKKEKWKLFSKSLKFTSKFTFITWQPMIFFFIFKRMALIYKIKNFNLQKHVFYTENVELKLKKIHSNLKASHFRTVICFLAYFLFTSWISWVIVSLNYVLFPSMNNLSSINLIDLLTLCLSSCPFFLTWIT